MSEGLAGTAADSEVERGKNLVENSDQDDEDEVPQLCIVGALVTLAGATVLIALCAESMVNPPSMNPNPFSTTTNYYRSALSMTSPRLARAVNSLAWLFYPSWVT